MPLLRLSRAFSLAACSKYKKSQSRKCYELDHCFQPPLIWRSRELLGHQANLVHTGTLGNIDNLYDLVIKKIRVR